MIIPRNPNAAPNHDAAYTTDTEGSWRIGVIQGDVHSVMPSPRFADPSEADRYCRFWNDFAPAFRFVVVRQVK